MTSEELIAKIKTYIERRKKSLRAGICNEEVFTRKQRNEMLVASEELDRLNRFLSTLESENPMNQDDAMKELDEKIALVKQRGTWDGVDVDKYMDEVRGREPEKPMNLEEEVKLYYSDNFAYISSDQPTLSILTNIARHFAEWGYLRAAEKYNEIEYNRQRAEENEKPSVKDAMKELDEKIALVKERGT